MLDLSCNILKCLEQPSLFNSNFYPLVMCFVLFQVHFEKIDFEVTPQNRLKILNSHIPVLSDTPSSVCLPVQCKNAPKNQQKQKLHIKEREKYFRVAFITFVWPDVKMCMKSHIWPFQTSSGKMFLLCMQNLSTTPSPENHSVPDPHL